MNKRDTIEDVIVYACGISAISTSTQDALLAELRALRAGAVEIPPPLAPDVDTRGINMIRTTAERRGRFNDPKSRAQIDAYLLHSPHVTDERNKVNLARWTEHHRDAWQLEHMGTKRMADIKAGGTE